MFGNKNTVNVGSRKSQLALIQTNHVVDQLKELYPEKTFRLVTMTTTGDQILDKPLPKIGEKSLFTKELEVALEQGLVDFVVHSLKDLPTTLPPGMCIGAICKREDPRDAVVLHQDFNGKTLSTLPKDSVIGTSSLRRAAQLHRKFPHLKVKDVRGNLNTRLAKLDKGDMYSGLVLASAGLERMSWRDRISQMLDAKEMLYAVGQGALAIECRQNDTRTLQYLEALQDIQTTLCVVAERTFLRTLGGGCSAPVAVHSELKDRTLTLTGAVWSLEGLTELEDTQSVKIRYCEEEDDGQPARKCPYRKPRIFCCIAPGRVSYLDLDAAEKLGTDVANSLIEKGALDVMNEAKQHIQGNIPPHKLPKAVECMWDTKTSGCVSTIMSNSSNKLSEDSNGVTNEETCQINVSKHDFTQVQNGSNKIVTNIPNDTLSSSCTVNQCDSSTVRS